MQSCIQYQPCSVMNGGGDLQSKVLNSSENKKLRVDGGNWAGQVGFRRFEQTWTRSLLLRLQS